MSTVAQDGVTKIDRSYIDNFAVKEYASDTLVATYFPDIDVSLRTTGMLGFTTEQLSNIAEDVFNTASVYFREMFPNRCEIDESIYSHAAIFQMTDIFSTPATCTFLMVLEEEAIHNNMTYDRDSGYYYFYIDKDTTIIIRDTTTRDTTTAQTSKEIYFVLDYDIQLKIVKKRTPTKMDYIYTAKYIMTDYENSMASTTNPYIKLRRAGGYLALELTCRQMTRDVVYDQITSNSKINYPTIDVAFDGVLAGFDIMYKEPTETEYTTQLDTLPVYSQPQTSPFCYYQLYDESTLRITFNSKDSYFMPEFNSEVKVVLYTTQGTAGEFDIYTGTNIEVIGNNENYNYVDNYVMSARPLGASEGAVDKIELEALRELTVEAYRTALALTTDNDLQEYFNNFKNRYGAADIKFIKLRNDIRERIYGAYMIVYHDDMVYKTNCLKLATNLSELTMVEANNYLLQAGTLFKYVEEATDEAELFNADFVVYESREESLYNWYLEDVEAGRVPYISEGTYTGDIPSYLDRPASFAEWKRRKGYDTKLTVFDMDEETLETYDDPFSGKFLYVNPFILKFRKNPNLVTMYMPFVDDQIELDFTNQNEDCYVQFIMYWIRVQRVFEKEKRYHFQIAVGPNINISDDYTVVYSVLDEDTESETYGERLYPNLNDPYSLDQNDLRVIVVLGEESTDRCFFELIPEEYDATENTWYFGRYIYSDDHVTSDTMLRLLSGTHYREADTGNYYMVDDDDATLYNYYDADGNTLTMNVPVDTVTELINDGTLTEWSTIMNMTANDDILVPTIHTTCKVYTLYRRVYSEEEGALVLTTADQTNNPFYEIDPTYEGYIWTNLYENTSSTDDISLMYNMDYVRCDLQFMDYTAYDEDGNFIYDINDVEFRCVPLVKWDLPLDTTEFSTFMTTYMNYYKWCVEIVNTRLRNVTALDVKWYNTYGKSKNYVIGNEEENLDTVNLTITFDMWFLPGTDTTTMVPKIKYFIKTEIEKLNDNCVNYVHISNLMRKLELEYSCIDHIRFRTINNYDTLYQSVKVLYEDVNDLDKPERLVYVPEMLNIDIEDIYINEYEIESY